ncbi:flagellar protein FlbB [Oceanispirochaeta crateris]|uniref:Flagellar protein FlbB n=1 Tax=Oceanispirochaeta crateris TaxID=2518645 RepID=A0A5C1QL03_9SPIO|nr:flagellar protein FlbB [Oceanispirochaeta crateris]QEN07889.1 flagellar protein FlbB [Oceanispirochaeta crateris]
MAGLHGGAGVAKIFFLIIFIVVLIVGGLLWVDFLGLIDARETLAPILKIVRLDVPEPIEQPDDLYLLDRERLEKQQEALDIFEASLVAREEGILIREAELEELTSQLEEKQKSNEEKEKSLNEALKSYDNKRANLEQNATYLEGMPPQNAVSIMLEMDDTELVDLLRTSERLATESGKSSLVAFWLSLMPAERAAEIQSKMALKPED